MLSVLVFVYRGFLGEGACDSHFNTKIGVDLKINTKFAGRNPTPLNVNTDY